MANPVQVVRQAAAIPIYEDRVCLITSRSGRRWVIPKGCIDPGMTAPQAAVQETWEEAGLVGTLSPDPVGSFLYDKFGITHHVVVYVMHVHTIHDEWPEADSRQRQWLKPNKAIARIEEPGLREILRGVLSVRRAE